MSDDEQRAARLVVTPELLALVEELFSGLLEEAKVPEMMALSDALNKVRSCNASTALMCVGTLAQGLRESGMESAVAMALVSRMFVHAWFASAREEQLRQSGMIMPEGDAVH